MRALFDRPIRILPLLLITSAMATACGGGGSGGLGAGPSILILTSGDEPRQVLRYIFEEGKKETLIFEMRMTQRDFNFGTKVQDVTIPPVRMTFEMESRNVTPEGNLEYGLLLTAMDVVDVGDVNPALMQGMREAVEPLIGLSAWGTVTPSGEAVETQFANPPGIPAESEQLMDGIQEQMGQMFSPLPDEPVGQGAMWKVTMPMESPQWDFTQEMTFWLQKLEGDYCEVSVTVKQLAEPQDMKELPAGAPAGASMHLDNLESTGYGTQAFRLSDIGGTADMTLNMGMDFTVNTGSGTQKRRTEMDMQVKILPGGGG